MEFSEQAQLDVQGAVEHLVAEDAGDATKALLQAIDAQVQMVAGAPSR